MTEYQPKQKIEYRRHGNWYPGTLVRRHTAKRGSWWISAGSSSTLDYIVKEYDLRLAPAPYSLGQKIEYRQGTKWFSGTFERPNNYSLDKFVVKGDHDPTRLVDADEVRPRQEYHIGDTVEWYSSWDKKSLSYRGIVTATRAHPDGEVTVTISSEKDGIFPMRSTDLRLVSHQPEPEQFTIGQEVEYRNSWDMWVKGKIRHRYDGTNQYQIENLISHGTFSRSPHQIRPLPEPQYSPGDLVQYARLQGVGSREWVDAIVQDPAYDSYGAVRVTVEPNLDYTTRPGNIRLRPTPEFKSGDLVEYFATGIGEWKPARVTNAVGRERYRLMVDSGKTTFVIHKDYVRAHPQPEPDYRTGYLVEYYREWNKTWPVTQSFAEGSDNVRPFVRKYSVGDKVKATAGEGWGMWEPATIKADLGDGDYMLMWEGNSDTWFRKSAKELSPVEKS